MSVLKRGELMRVQYAHPGESPETIGVIMLDATTDAVSIRFTSDWSAYKDEETLILCALEEDLHEKAHYMGGAALVRYLLDTLSNTILISDPEVVYSANLEEELNNSWVRELPATTLTSDTLFDLRHYDSSRLGYSWIRLGIATAAGIVLALLISRGTSTVRIRTPQRVALRETRNTHSLITTVGNSLTAPTLAPLVIVRRKGPRPRPAHSMLGPRRHFVVPVVVLEEEHPQPSLLDESADVMIVTSDDLTLPQLSRPLLPEPEERRGKRVVQALTLPFRKLGKLISE